MTIEGDLRNDDLQSAQQQKHPFEHPAELETAGKNCWHEQLKAEMAMN